MTSLSVKYGAYNGINGFRASYRAITPASTIVRPNSYIVAFILEGISCHES